MSTRPLSAQPHSPPRPKHELRGRIIIAAALIAVILTAILAPPAVLAACLMIAAGLGSYELFENTVGRQLQGRWSHRPAAVTCILTAALLPIVAYSHPRLYAINLAFTGLAIALIRLSAHRQLWQSYRPTRSTLAISIFAVAWTVGGTLGALVPIRLSTHGVLWLLVILALNTTSDTGAYAVGRSWDKLADYLWTPQHRRHKPCPALSPGKTWAGFIGGAITTLITGLALALARHNPIFVTLALTIAITAPLGDLFFSWLKRRLGIKDWSRRLGHHGGALDRLDSLTWTAAAAYILLAITSQVTV